VKIAITGAAHTGKTRLVHELAQALRARGHTVQTISPQHDEDPAPLSDASGAAFVLVDGTSLLSAVRCDGHFADASRYALALAQQRSYDMTLLTGLDIPWLTDDPDRNQQGQREASDNLLRGALERAGLPYRVIYGLGDSRWQGALSIVDAIVPASQSAMNSIAGSADFARPWAWFCDKCSDPHCEHRLFSSRLQAEAGDPATAGPRSAESANRWR